MEQKNIRYRSKAIEQFYRTHRTCWSQFYESEREVLSRLGLKPDSRVVDIGCGCGGLGLALKDRFGVTDYTGVEINSQAVAAASEINPEGLFLSGDILDIHPGSFAENGYDLAVSLSCIDWNIEFDRMLAKAYSLVKPGGYFMASFRLTDAKSVVDIAQSYQHINFDGRKEGEVAPYVVLNARELFQKLLAFQPSRMMGYGYWGTPSSTAVTPFERVCFAVLAIQKGGGDCVLEVDLPVELKPFFMHLG